MKWAMDCTAGSGFGGEYEFALKKVKWQIRERSNLLTS